MDVKVTYKLNLGGKRKAIYLFSGLVTSHHLAPPLQMDVVSAHEQLDPATESLPVAYRSRKRASRHARSEIHLPSSAAGLATVSSPASTILKSTNLEIPHLHAAATGPSRERQLSAVDESADELGDENYANHSDTSSNVIEGPCPRKRPRWSRDLSSTTDCDIEESSGCSVELSNEDVATNQSRVVEVGYSSRSPLR